MKSESSLFKRMIISARKNIRRGGGDRGQCLGEDEGGIERDFPSEINLE